MSKDRGFDDIQLMELGFKQHRTHIKGEYYWEYKTKNVTLVTNETNFELSQGNLYTLMLLTDYNEITIRNARDFEAIVKILENQ